MTFHVGQKVVCVDVSKGFRNMLGEYSDCPDIKLNEVYTIAWSGPNDNGVPAVRLVEVPARRAPRGKNASNAGYPFFGADRFRPIVERKAEISFTANAPKDSEKWDNRKRVKVRA